MPTEIVGQAVLSTDEAWKQIGYGNASSLLVAGTIGFAPMPCLVRGASAPPDALDCPSGYLLGSLEPNGAYLSLWTDATSDSLLRRVASLGPVVLRVHAYDPRASACPIASRRECELAVVVEDLVWPSVSTVQPSPSAG